ncbi:unnamed protein product, partial [Onchocerca ochengi]|uniref:Spore coat protein Z n=1 Tax=Onchocerca ochengi TaxID=42157 RepID=A0A182E114_ONCOC
MISNLPDCKELLCYSCNSQFGPCDGNGCSISNGFCVYQQITNANGNILSTVRSCLDGDRVPAGPLHVIQAGQCTETVDPNTGIRYRTYLCNNYNYCNADCHPQLPTVTNDPISPTRASSLECFNCNNFGTDCYGNICTINNGGYCFFQFSNVSVNGISSLHYNKQCIEVPFAKTPNGNSITEINKCVVSTDMLGNHFYTLICNEANLCNANCNLVPADTPIPVPVVPRSSSS